MDATKRPWHIGPYYKYDIESPSGYVASFPMTPQGIANAAHVVRAVNRDAIFDQAREALKDACLTYAVHGDQPPQKWLEALAAMEATLCQPDK